MHSDKKLQVSKKNCVKYLPNTHLEIIPFTLYLLGFRVVT